jgi:uncharacterized protein (TIGR02466 family)
MEHHSPSPDQVNAAAVVLGGQGWLTAGSARPCLIRHDRRHRASCTALLASAAGPVHGLPMAVTMLFPTPLWQAALPDAALLADLAHSCRSLAIDDAAGRRWSREHRYRGYTSYASLDDLPQRDPAFASLARWLNRQAGQFAEAAGLDLGGRKLRLDSLWVNILKPGGGHSGHIHPHSLISGTLYVEAPDGAGAIRFEDPRLPMFMHAPQRRTDAPAVMQNFISVSPTPGLLLLWESWLRHEVLPSAAGVDRISISFNFA